MKIIVIGGGAAGMIAAIAAARSGKKVILFEKNEKLGKKLYITGKGRCNITNCCDTEGILENIVSNSRFMYSSLYGFTNYDVMGLMEELGCPVKVERGERVFPQSDKSSDVISALYREMKRLGVEIRYNSPVQALHGEGKFQSVTLTNGDVIAGDACIVATGGLSYPSTGSTGDGYDFAKNAGHAVTTLSPSLVPFNIKEVEECRALQGLSLRNIECIITADGKEFYRDFGEMLFTHFGVSGPVILSGSAFLQPHRMKDIRVHLNLKPALTKEQLNQRILRDFEKNKNREFKNALDELLPRKMIPVIMKRSGILPDKKVNSICKEERMRLLEVVTNFTLTFQSLRSYNEAIITKGGIKVNEVHPTTMESKLVPGLHFAGEVLDLDALTGGFNLQIAWSTGYAAGIHAGGVKSEKI